MYVTLATSGLNVEGSVMPSGYPASAGRNAGAVGFDCETTALITCGPLIISRFPEPARWKWT